MGQLSLEGTEAGRQMGQLSLEGTEAGRQMGQLSLEGRLGQRWLVNGEVRPEALGLGNLMGTDPPLEKVSGFPIN